MASCSRQLGVLTNYGPQFDYSADLDRISMGTRNSSSPSIPTTHTTSSSSGVKSNLLPESCHIGVRCPLKHTENLFSVKLTDSIGQLRRHAVYRSKMEVNDALNYGLYLPPEKNKRGKFLEDERPIADYPMLYRQAEGHKTGTGSSSTVTDSDVCWLELIYKSRMDSEENAHTSRLQKLKTKMSRNHFMELVRNCDVKTIGKWLEKGFDPNFWSKKDGEAPLTLAASQFHPRALIIALVNGGAHLDFRAKDSHTALHRAAVFGVYEAIKTLLDLGQNPNCRDWHGLTPLYYAVQADISARCTQALLYDHAILGVEDDQGFQEIHQACKTNRSQHLENLIAYGVDLNARTKKGACPMHICVMFEADACLRLLLVRGADLEQKNEDGQSPLEYALLTNRNTQAQLIQDFRPEDLVTVKDTPSYNVGRRATLNGPRGAVYYSELYRNTMERQSILDTPNPSRRGSLFDLLSIASVESLGTGLTPSPSLGRQKQQQHEPLEEIAKSMDRRLKASEVGRGKYNSIGFNTIAGPPVHSRPMLVNDGLPPRKLIASMISSNKSLDIRPDKLNEREVTLRKGKEGYGFILNGISRLILLKEGRAAIPGFLANQYFSSITPGGPADDAGVKQGDYLLSISGEDLSEACHEDAVEYIRMSGDNLIMRIVTPSSSSKRDSIDSVDNSSHSSNDEDPYSMPQKMHRRGSMRRPSVEQRSSRNREKRPPIADRRRAQSASNAYLLSPAAESKERVYVLKKFDGKIKAVLLEDDSKPAMDLAHEKINTNLSGNRHNSMSDSSSNTFLASSCSSIAPQNRGSERGEDSALHRSTISLENFVDPSIATPRSLESSKSRQKHQGKSRDKFLERIETNGEECFLRPNNSSSTSLDCEPNV